MEYPGGYNTLTPDQTEGFPNMNLDLSCEDTRAYVKQISTESLGDHSYIVVVRDEAVAIDIQRDLDRFEEVVSDFDVSLVAIFETHIHNDYVSGGKRLADIHGAAYVLPADTGAPYDHTPLSDGETIGVGGWVMRAMHTPGHTTITRRTFASRHPARLPSSQVDRCLSVPLVDLISSVLITPSNC